MQRMILDPAHLPAPPAPPHLTGTGIFFTMYSHTTSTLYMSCAEMGTTGAPSAMVPC